MRRAGMELQYRSAVRRGLPWPRRYLRRAAVLSAVGFLNYLLVFEWDVLMGYAITSAVVAFLIRRSHRVQNIWMIGITGLGGLWLAVSAVRSILAPQGEPAAPPSVAQTYVGQPAGRLTEFPVYRSEIPIIAVSGIVIFLLGARLLRAGAFEPGPNRIRRRLLLVGAVALPLNLATSFGGHALHDIDRYLLAPLVALGLLAAIVELAHRARDGRARRGVIAVGRTALSCYVFTNFAAGALCYAWGLDLANRFAGYQLVWVPLLWLGLGVLQVGMATLWLRRFERGPIEIVFHRVLARG